jgi:hypothetical protein
MRLAALACAAVLLSTRSVTAFDGDPIEWSWRCKNNGYYGMEVLPDGSYKPQIDKTTAQIPVILNIRKVVQCKSESLSDEYYAEIKGDGLVQTYNNSLSSYVCRPLVNVSYDNKSLESISGSFSSQTTTNSLIISRDDNSWRFLMSGVSLTTERHGRKLRIIAPQPGVAYEASASTWIETGECVLTVGSSQMPSAR